MTSSLACADCSTSCPNGSGVNNSINGSPCTPTADRQCDVCSPGFYKDDDESLHCSGECGPPYAACSVMFSHLLQRVTRLAWTASTRRTRVFPVKIGCASVRVSRLRMLCCSTHNVCARVLLCSCTLLWSDLGRGCRTGNASECFTCYNDTTMVAGPGNECSCASEFYDENPPAGSNTNTPLNCIGSFESCAVPMSSHCCHGYFLRLRSIDANA